MEPMTDGQAFSWLTSGKSPAGTLVSDTRARRLMSWARDAGAVHLTKGPDLRAPGHILTYDHDTSRYEVLPARPEGQAPDVRHDDL